MPQKLYSRREDAVRFEASGGNVVLTLTSLANGAGRVSAQYDRGVGGAADRFIWRFKTTLAVAAALGAVLTIYLVTSDGTDADGNLGTTDAALPALDRRRNLVPIGSVIADAASTGPFKASGVVEILERFVQVVVVNEMGQALSASAGDHAFVLTPVPPEVQDSV